MATRKFSYDSRVWDDPDPTLTPEQIKQTMVPFFPELSTADVREVKDEKDPETTVYEFQRKTGTKSTYDVLTAPMLIAALKSVKEFHIDLIDLSWQFLKEDGTIDDKQLQLHAKEINEAADQAAGYVQSVRKSLARVLSFRNRLK